MTVSVEHKHETTVVEEEGFGKGVSQRRHCDVAVYVE